MHNIFRLKFKTKSADLNVDEIKYDLMFHEWNPPILTLQMNLDDPASLSRNTPDTVEVEYLRPEYFRSKTGNKVLDLQIAKVVTQIPRQLPPGTSAKSLIATAQESVNNVQYFLIIQLIV